MANYLLKNVCKIAVVFLMAGCGYALAEAGNTSKTPKECRCHLISGDGKCSNQPATAKKGESCKDACKGANYQFRGCEHAK